MISKRLRTIASFVSEKESVLDVGTDHALLPIYLRQKYPHMVIGASDVAKGPLEFAKENIEKYHADDIHLYHSDGVMTIPDEYDTVILAGMGAKLMISILGKGHFYFQKAKKLILSPNYEVSDLRDALNKMHYAIIDEDIICEHKYYEIMVVTPHTEQKMNHYDIDFGPVLRKKKSDDFRKRWEFELKHLVQIQKGLPKGHPDKENMKKRIRDIRYVLR